MVPRRVCSSYQSQSAKEINIFSVTLLLTTWRQFCPILNQGADQLFWLLNVSSSLSQRQFCPILKRGTDGMCSLSSLLLLAIPEAVLSHTKARSISAVQFIPYVAPCCPRINLVPYKTRCRFAVQSLFCVAPHCPIGSLVQYQSEENKFNPVLDSLGTGGLMAQDNKPTSGNT